MRRCAALVLVVLALGVSASANELQSQWRRCKKCDALFLPKVSSPSACPVGATHKAVSGHNYLVPYESFTEDGQHGWRVCNRCRQLVFAGGGDHSPSVCPKGGAHDPTGSANYKLLNNPVPDVTTEEGWMWCIQCGALFLPGSGTASDKCAAGGAHKTPWSVRYFMIDALPPKSAITIADDVGFPFNGAEVQSTVVGPGVHEKCPDGRLFISSDDIRGTNGTIVYRDLPAGPWEQSTVHHAPNVGPIYEYGTNDHDLVSRSDGTIFYVNGAWSRDPNVSSKPWFNQAWRWDFGPGARSVVMVWRSTDCGKNFTTFPSSSTTRRWSTTAGADCRSRRARISTAMPGSPIPFPKWIRRLPTGVAARGVRACMTSPGPGNSVRSATSTVPSTIPARRSS
ncbi:MAG TPA: hypothetical protein VF432_08805 [Thermoanaerobaculia bacterium]